MNEFIHTCSGVSYLTKAQFNRMQDTYNRTELFCVENRKWVFCKYAHRGVRAEIIFTPYIEKVKGKRYEDYKLTWIITPAKLIFHGEPMKKLFVPEEYTKACSILKDILQEIKKDSGADLFNETKLYRVDLTKDIATPSEVYTREVIRLGKVALDKYGYYLLDPDTIEEKKEEWKDENGIFFHNDNQEVQAKIYNKVEDLRIHGFDTGKTSGLLRFELALKREFLKTKKFISGKYISIEELPDILISILLQAPELMQKYVADPLWDGAMVSREIQNKFIRRYCDYKTDSVKYKKMITYRKACNHARKMENVKDKSIVKWYFADMGLSPLCCSKEVGYIPAFTDLLAEREDKRIVDFADRLKDT